jgi:hypothetical protein
MLSKFLFLEGPICSGSNRRVGDQQILISPCFRLQVGAENSDPNRLVAYEPFPVVRSVSVSAPHAAT